MRLVTGWLFAQMLTAGALFGQVMTQGPFIGSATPSEAKVFVRTDQPANVTLRYGSDPNLDAYLESAAFATGSPNDLAEIISLSGLTPGSSYYFNVLVKASHSEPGHPILLLQLLVHANRLLHREHSNSMALHPPAWH